MIQALGITCWMTGQMMIEHCHHHIHAPFCLCQHDNKEHCYDHPALDATPLQCVQSHCDLHFLAKSK